MKKVILSLMAISVLSFVCVINSNFGASFNRYAPKLLKFEGEGYGIHKPIWGYRIFSKEEALSIHRHNYWNRYYGDLFKNQDVAEVFIDHLINAGEGKHKRNIKAFEKIIGVEQDGVITKEDIEAANNFERPEDIVNPYVQYRLSYYRTRKYADENPGWFKRAKSFFIQKPNEAKDEDMAIEEYIVLPPAKNNETTVEDLQ